MIAFPLEFFVPGVPAPGGSKKSFHHSKTGKIVTMDMAKRNKPWRESVAFFASQAMGGAGLLDQPLDVTMTFVASRPKGHWGTFRGVPRLKPSAPDYPTVKPDVLKLARSTEDAMTGVVWRDDASTVRLTLAKRYGERPGVWVRIQPMDG